MVPGAARLAGHPAADFQEWKIRRAVKLGRELGAKAVEVCGVKLYFPHPVGSADCRTPELQAGLLEVECPPVKCLQGFLFLYYLSVS